MHIAALVLPVLAVIVTGWIVGRLAIPPRALVQLAYYVAMPALLFGAVARLPLSGLLLDGVGRPEKALADAARRCDLHGVEAAEGGG